MKMKQIVCATLLMGANIAFGANGATTAGQKGGSQNGSGQNTGDFLGDKLAPYNNPNRFIVDLSFIYWQAYADNLEYGLARDGQVGEKEITISEVFDYGGASFSEFNKDQKMQFHWDPGFKAGIGVIFGEKDEWDLFLNWTWLKTIAKGSFSNPVFSDEDVFSFEDGLENPTISNNIVPSWSPVALGGPAKVAKSHWRLLYNTLDLELGRNFFLLNNVTMRPHIGLRAASLHQHINSTYDAELNFFNWSVHRVPTDHIQSFSPYSKFKGKNEFNGLGLRGGFDVNWNFYDQFAIYGKLSTSALWGRFSVYENFKSSDSIVATGLMAPEIPFPINFNLTDTFDETILDNFHAIRMNFQCALGFTWHTDFNDDRQHLYISLGYEFNEWFNQNQLRDLFLDPPANLLLPPDDPDLALGLALNSFNKFGRFNYTTKRQGDIGLQGLTFDVRFDF